MLVDWQTSQEVNSIDRLAIIDRFYTCLINSVLKAVKSIDNSEPIYTVYPFQGQYIYQHIYQHICATRIANGELCVTIDIIDR